MFTTILEKRSQQWVTMLHWKRQTATGLSYTTICKIITSTETSDMTDSSVCRTAIFTSPGKTRKSSSPITGIDDFDLSVIRSTVIEIFRDNQYPTVTKIWEWLKNKIEFEGSETSLRRILVDKLKYGKIDNRKFYTERSDVVAQHHRYLRQVHAYREQSYHFVYLDETWVNENHAKIKQWHDKNSETIMGKKIPIGRRRRLILLHAGSEDGFVQNDELLFQSKTNSENYHMKWMEIVSKIGLKHYYYQIFKKIQS